MTKWKVIIALLLCVALVVPVAAAAFSGDDLLDDLMVDVNFSEPVVPLADVVPVPASQLSAFTLSPSLVSGDTIGVLVYDYYLYMGSNVPPIQSRLVGAIGGITSLQLSGQVLSGSNSVSYSFKNGTNSEYSNGVGVFGRYADEDSFGVFPASLVLNFKFPSGVYSYQPVGSVAVTATVNGVSKQSVYQMTDNLTSSILPISSVDLSIDFSSASTSVTLPGEGTMRYSISIDLSNLQFYINQTSDSILLTLPSGQYLNSAGGITTASNVPAYTYLSQGLLGLGNDLMGSTGSISGSYYANGQSGATSATYTSIGQLLSTMFRVLSSDLAFDGSVGYLDSDGSITTYSGFVSFANAFRRAMLGLGNDLMGPSGSITISSLRRPGSSSASMSLSFSSLGNFFQYLYADLMSDLTLASGSSFLNSVGSVSSTSVNLGISSLLQSGFLGIANDLMGSDGSITANRYMYLQSGALSKSYSSLGALLGDFMATSTVNSLLEPNFSFLTSNGTNTSFDGYLNEAKLLARGFTGLGYLLRGTSGSTISSQTWSFDANLNKTVKTTNFTNVLQALASIQSSIQQPLSQLQAVLANDDDLYLRQRTQDQVDQVTEDFTGSGSGSPTLSDIGDMANVSGQMNTLFDSGVGAGDFFTAVNTSDSYQFFSQAVANDLDSSAAPALMALSVEDDFSQYVMDEDGFYSLADVSFFDLSVFLGKGG